MYKYAQGFTDLVPSPKGLQAKDEKTKKDKHSNLAPLRVVDVPFNPTYLIINFFHRLCDISVTSGPCLVEIQSQIWVPLYCEGPYSVW